MWKLILLFTAIGGLFLIFSRMYGNTLHYLGGYLFLISYLSILITILITAKSHNYSLTSTLKLIVGVFIGMTLLYIIFVMIRSNL